MHAVKKRGFHLTQIDKLGVMALMSTIGVALVTTIWAIFLESLLHDPSQVGFLSSLFTGVAVVSYVLFVPYIESHNKTRVYSLALFLFGLSYLAFAFFENIIAVVFIGVILYAVSTLKVTSFGIMLRDKSKDSKVSSNIGLIYTFFNMGWLIAPVIAGFLADRYGFKIVFLVSALIMFVAFFLFRIFNVKDNRVERPDNSIFKLLKEYFSNKNRVYNYLLSGGINFWWALIYIYIPIMIIESSLSDIAVGYFLSFVVIPLVLFEYYFGKLTSRVGFKKMFFVGYVFLAVSALLCFFLFSNIYVVLGIITIASVGAAMIEPTTEAYFFDIVSKKQRDKFYGPYNTAIDLHYSLATFFGAVVLVFFDFRVLFIYFAVVMVFMAFISLKIKNVVEKRR